MPGKVKAMGDWKRFVGVMMPLMNEKQRRIFLAGLAEYLGHGSQQQIIDLTKVSNKTIKAGKNEIATMTLDPVARPSADSVERVRASGAGRKPVEVKFPKLREELLKLLDGNTIGNPENPLCWTTKSLRNLQKCLEEKGFNVKRDTIARVLKDLGFSLQQNMKFIEPGRSHPDRDGQFRFINGLAAEFLAEGLPVISIDAKKKELIGNYKNGGAEYAPKGQPVEVFDHDFPGPEGKATPYGIYDVSSNEGYVNVGVSGDTGEFAVNSIRCWWNSMGRERYPKATKLLITADGGGSNGSRNKLWKKCLQELATEIGLEIHVSHFPPGTSKWNKIEHSLFSFISKNWRGRPLTSLRVIVNLIASTTTKAGLKVKCGIDKNVYEKGIKVSDTEMHSLSLEEKDWHGDWNYVLQPQTPPLLPNS